MEIILNPNMCISFTGRICRLKTWHIRCIHGRFFSVCRSKDEAYWRTTLPTFYNALKDYQATGFIRDIILTPKEKEVLGL